MLALSIFGMALAGVTDAHAAEDDDDDDEVIEEVVVTAYRWPIIITSNGYGYASFAYYDDNGRLRTSDQDAYDAMRDWILNNSCLPAEVKIIGGVAAATYVCSHINIPGKFPGKSKITGTVKAACVAFALLHLDDIPEC